MSLFDFLCGFSSCLGYRVAKLVRPVCLCCIPLDRASVPVYENTSSGRAGSAAAAGPGDI